MGRGLLPDRWRQGLQSGEQVGELRSSGGHVRNCRLPPEPPSGEYLEGPASKPEKEQLHGWVLNSGVDTVPLAYRRHGRYESASAVSVCSVCALGRWLCGRG